MTDRDDLEARLDDLATDATASVRDWVDAVLAGEWDVEFGDDPSAEFTTIAADGTVLDAPDHTGQVCILEMTGDVGTEFWIPETDVPEWIDVETDLPVKE